MSKMKILYVCTHNRCRSILSEATTNAEASADIIAKSAGSQPVGEVHPLSLRYLAECNIPCDDLTSQSWNEFEQFAPDVVVTVCDSAAAESCPAWMGKGLKIHWGLADPSKLQGTEQEVRDAFMQCIELIKQRVGRLAQIAQQPSSTWQDALNNLVAES